MVHYANASKLQADAIVKLIDLVREYPALYDPRDEQYKRLKFKNHIWHRLGTSLNMTGSEAKKQWQSLRKCHGEAVRKRKRGLTDCDKTWAFESEMDFLTDAMDASTTTTAKSRSNSVCESSGGSVVADDDDIFNRENETVKETEDYVDEESKSVADLASFDSAMIVGEEEIRNPGVVSGKKRRRLMSEEYIDDDDEENKALRNFFVFAYNSTKRLPVVQQKNIKRRLFKIVNDAEDEANFGALCKAAKAKNK